MIISSFTSNLKIKIIKVLGYTFFLLLGIIASLYFSAYSHANNDLLNQAYDEAKRYDYVINPGNDKEAVGGQVFNPTVQVNIGGGNGGSETKEPYLTRLTKLILRIMIALSVSIVIFAGISYMLALGDAAKQKKALNIAKYALIGIVLGLASLAIVQLVLSITKSSLQF